MLVNVSPSYGVKGTLAQLSELSQTLRRLRIRWPMYLVTPNTPWRLWIVRHGESEANLLGTEFMKQYPDGSAALTPRGLNQAEESAQRIYGHILDLGLEGERFSIYQSPYTRAKQTANPTAELLDNRGIWIERRTTVPELREMSYGPADSVPREDWNEVFGHAGARHELLTQAGWRIDAAPPGGEDPFTVMDRGSQALDRFARHRWQNGVHNHIIFAHGWTNRLLIARFLDLSDPVAFIRDQPNPGNGSVNFLASDEYGKEWRTIWGGEDKEKRNHALLNDRERRHILVPKSAERRYRYSKE